MSFTGKPSLTELADINNDGFWPALSMADLVSKYRIPTEYDDPVIETGLILAMIRVNEALERIKTEVMEVLAYADFAAYLADNSQPIADRELIQVHYESAVYARAKAILLQQFVTMNRRDIAESEAKESEQTEQYWLDESGKSVASMLSFFFPDETFSSSPGFMAVLI